MKRLPAEFEAQSAVWCTWPGNPDTWPDHRKEVQRDHAGLVSACTRFQAVELICADPWRNECEWWLAHAEADLSRITFHDWPANDAWTRDHGPVFLKTETGGEVLDLPFQAWGQKFPDFQEDDDIARRVSELRNLPRHRFPMFGEGGGLESNGQGDVIVTESVWLNPNRNPGVSRNEIEQALSEAIGAEKIHWLKAGMASDDTDGHVDTLARFISRDQVVMPFPGEDHPDVHQLLENLERLSQSFEVIRVPHPLIQGFPASYVNFVFLKNGLLVPLYDVAQDEAVLSLFQNLFPDREVLGIPSTIFLQEGGAVHCLTCNEWA